jgi:hypothetical protein
MLNNIKCWFNNHDFIYDSQYSLGIFARNMTIIEYIPDTIVIKYKCSCCEKTKIYKLTKQEYLVKQRSDKIKNILNVK